MYSIPYHIKDLSNFSFLVTGGAGFIGSHIVEYLMQFNAGKVRVLDNYITGNKNNILQFADRTELELVEGDLRDPGTCQSACKGMDFVVHQAALGSVPRSVEDPATTNAINVDGFLNILTAARDNQVKRFVYASSSSVYGDSEKLPKVEEETGRPLSPYAVTKKTNELYAKVFGDVYQMETIGLRYFNIFGPRQDPKGPYAAVVPIFVQKTLKDEPIIIHGDGEQSRDFTFVENAVQANIVACLVENKEAVNEVYNIGCGSKYSINYLCESIKSKLGKNSEVDYRAERKGDIKHSLANIEKAKRLMGYEPTVNLEQGIDRTVAFYKASEN